MMDSNDIPRIAGTLAGVEQALTAFAQLHKNVDMTYLGNPNHTYSLLSALAAAQELSADVNRWIGRLTMHMDAPDEAELLRLTTETLAAQYEAYPPIES